MRWNRLAFVLSKILLTILWANNTNPTKISRGLEGWRSSPDFVNEFNVIIRTLFLMEKYFPEFPGSAENYASKGIRNNGRCFFLQYSRNTQTLQFSRITLLKLFTSFAIGHMDICISHLMPLVSFHNPWNYQKTRGLLMFTRSTKRDQQHEMGYVDHGTLFYRMTGIIDISFFLWLFRLMGRKESLL